MQISNEGILVILFVGLVAGWLAGKIVRGTGFGIIGDILVGIAGALLASLLFPKLGIRIGTGLVSEIVYSTIGAVILLLIVRLVRTGGTVVALDRFQNAWLMADPRDAGGGVGCKGIAHIGCRRSGGGLMAAGGRVGRRKAAFCSISRANRPGLDVGDSGAVSAPNRSPNPPRGWRRRQISCPKRATSVSTRFMGVNWIQVNVT